MELKDFIVSAVTDLTEGVKEADAKVKELGGMVNPGTHQYSGTDSEEFVHPRTALNFDIAVSASSRGEAGGGLKAKIMVVEANIGASKETTSESVSRLTFSLDVALPSDRDQKRRLGTVRR